MGTLSTGRIVKLWQGPALLVWGLPSLVFFGALVPIGSVHPLPRALVGLGAALVGAFLLSRPAAPAPASARLAAWLAGLAWAGAALAFISVGPEARARWQPGLAEALNRVLAQVDTRVRPLALDPWHALIEWGHLAGLLLLAIGVARTLRPGEHGARLASALAGIGVAVVVFALLHRLTGAQHVGWASAFPDSGDPFFAPFVSPNHGAAMCAACLPLAVALGRRNRVWGLAALVLLGGLVMAGSRAGFVDAAAGCAVLLALIGGARIRAALAGLAGLGLVGALVVGPTRLALWLTATVTPETYEAIDKGYTDVFTGRLSVYNDAMRLIASAPWVGTGPGGFDDGYQITRSDVSYRFADHAHQEILQIWAEHGLAVLLLGVGATLALAWTVAKARSDADQRLWSAAFAGVLGALLTDGLVDFPLRIGALAALAFIAAGAAVGLSGEGASARWPRLGQAGLAALLLGGVLTPVLALNLRGNLSAVWAPADEAEARGDKLVREAIAAEKAGGRDSPYRALLATAADTSYQAAVGRSPTRWQSLQKLGRLRGATGDTDGALQALRAATLVYPSLPGPWTDLARYERKLGDDAASDEAWRTLLLLDQPEGVDDAALVVEALGPAVAASDDVNGGALMARAHTVLPERADRWVAAAALADTKGARKAARALLEEAARISPDASVELGAALMRWGQVDEARAALAQAPKTCRASLLSGEALLKASLPAEAAPHFREAMSLCDERPRRARYGLARALTASGDPAGLDLLRTLVKEAPKDSAARRALIDGLLAAGEGAEAEQHRATLRAQRGDQSDE